MEIGLRFIEELNDCGTFSNSGQSKKWPLSILENTFFCTNANLRKNSEHMISLIYNTKNLMNFTLF